MFDLVFKIIFQFLMILCILIPAILAIVEGFGKKIVYNWGALLLGFLILYLFISNIQNFHL